MKVNSLFKPFVAALYFFALSLGAASAGAFLKIEGVEGESQDRDHENWIELLSVSTGVQRSGEGRESRAELSDTVITFQIDKSSPTLFLACYQGRVFPTAEIELTRAINAARPVTYLKYKLTNVVVTSYQTSASSDDLPTEKIALNFETIEMEYTVITPDGGPGQKITSGEISTTGNTP